MKSLKVIFIIFAVIFSFSEAKKVDDVTYGIYSMVFSGKYYNPGEIKEFFWVVPTAFLTKMKINSSLNTLNLDFQGTASAASSFLKIMREEGQKAEDSEFGSMLSFADEFTNLTFDLSNLNQKISITNVRVYGNQAFKSIEVKFMVNQSKVKRSFYVTFDFFKKNVEESDIQLFIDYVNSKVVKPRKENDNLRSLD